MVIDTFMHLEKHIVIGSLVLSLRSETYDARVHKASADTLDKHTSKETVNLAQLLTYVFVVRKISEFVVHVFDFKRFVSTKHVWVLCWSIS